MKKPVWYKTDVGLNARMAITLGAMFLLYAAFVFFLYSVLRGGLALIIIIAVGVLIFQLFTSDKVAIWSMGAQEVSEQQAPKLHAMVERLAQQTNLPKPKIAIARNGAPNAFATGRDQKHAVICVTTSLLSKLDDNQLEAVLAHEMTHILNNDMQVMTLIMFVPMLAGMLMQFLSRMFLWGAMFGGYGGGGFGGGRGRGRDNNGGALAIMLLVLVGSAVVSAVSFLLTRAFSRYREFAADRGSALITGAPQNLESALMAISGQQVGRIPDADLRSADAVSAFCFVPVSNFRNQDEFSELFSTHPSLQHRIERLQQIQLRMEQAPRIHE